MELQITRAVIRFCTLVVRMQKYDTHMRQPGQNNKLAHPRAGVVAGDAVGVRTFDQRSQIGQRRAMLAIQLQ
jgi:hypothetical protein